VIYVVEAVDVAPENLDAYLEAFEASYLPGALGRGMELVACLHTPRAIGEDVTVTTIFGVRDWAHWEEVRNAAVVDPTLPGWIERRRALSVRGTRRFYEPAAVSPLQ